MPKEVILNAEKSFIGAWLLDDTQICDNIIDYFESSYNKIPGLYNHKQLGNIVDKSIKDSLDVRLNVNSQCSRDYSVELNKVVVEYLKLYEQAGDTGPWADEGGGNIQKYLPGAAYHQWHTERTSIAFPGVTRHLVFMTFLNDVFTGGETEFMYQKIKVSPRKGLTLIWPADWTHTHRGLISPSETKYIITGWFSFV